MTGIVAGCFPQTDSRTVRAIADTNFNEKIGCRHFSVLSCRVPQSQSKDFVPTRNTDGEYCKMTTKLTRRLTFLALTGCVVLSCLGSIGCQTTRNGQTLPSPQYLYDDIQYFPAGPEFPLSKEAAQMEKDEAEQLQSRNQR